MKEKRNSENKEKDKSFDSEFTVQKSVKGTEEIKGFGAVEFN